jgi:hypothetical protein
MYRTYVIFRHTFLEAVVQPIYGLLLGLGVVILLIFGKLPFFALGQDTVMFKAVGLDVVLLLVLVSTLFATSKSIFDEIEDRTMLTLMSKPVQRWEVMLGKYLGIIASALLGVFVLGLAICMATYWRIPEDYMLRMSLDEYERQRIHDYRAMHIAGLIPSLVLIWMQVSVLAAIGVALSTRFSLVVNLPIVLSLYIAGNLTRFFFPIFSPGGPLEERSGILKGIAYVISFVLPYLETFDLRALTVYRPITLKGSIFEGDPNGASLLQIWSYLGAAGLYAVAYAVFALSIGMWMFRTRELGGAEG